MQYNFISNITSNGVKGSAILGIFSDLSVNSLSKSINATNLKKIKAAIKKQLTNHVTIKTKQGKIIIKEPWLPSKKTYIEVDTNNHYYKSFIRCNYSVYANQINFFHDMIAKRLKSPTFPNLSFDDTLVIAKISLEWRNKLINIKN